MRRNLIFVLCLVALLSLCSCGKVDEVSQRVIDDINAIGEVTVDDEELILKIEDTYSTLTDKQKNQVSNYATFLDAKDTLKDILEEEKAILEEELKKSEAEYGDTLVVALGSLINAAQKCESIIGNVKEVWNPRGSWGMDYIEYIYEKNCGAMSRFGITEYCVYDTVLELEAANTEVEEFNKKLQKCPESFAEQKAIYDELYDDYLFLHKMAISPSGNYLNYCSDTNSYIDSFVTNYEKLSNLIMK